MSAAFAPKGNGLLSLALVVLTCTIADAKKKNVETHYGSSGIDLSARDLSVRPGDDFNAYASGAWQKRMTIPPDQTDAGPFIDIDNRTQDRLRAMFEECASKPANAASRQIGDLYRAFMDEKRIERLGDRPIEPDLQAIRSLPDKEALANRMGEAQHDYGHGFFTAEVKVDAKKPELNVLRLRQAGLGMSDREMYLKDDFKALKTAYRDYARRTLKLIRWPDADKAAEDIVAMETRIAEASWSLTDSGDRTKMYNPMSVSDLETLAPAFPWRAYLRGAGIERVDRLIVGQNTAFPRIAEVFDETPLQTLKAWEALQIVDEASPYLPKKFVDSRFAFRGQAEQGLKRDQPRWKRGVALLNVALDKAVGREYVTQYFPPESKANIEALVANLKAAMRARIERLQWMGAETKAAALAKLSRLRVMVGYPDEWRDYSGLKINPTDVYGSVRAAKAFNWNWELGKLSQPVDRGEWLEPPQMVDAYSDVGRVAIVFPAGILQPPFFDPQADRAANYGAIGTVIGHEITHQFDNQGRKFDQTGALREWWTAKDAGQFEEAAARLVTQVDAYEAFPGIHLNGKLTLGENIADLGGLLIALDAYHASLKDQPAPEIDGTTGDQRVFLGWAQFLRTKTREEIDKQQAAAGVHALPRFRVIGSTRNIDVWYEAFDVKRGDRYYLDPSDRVHIW